MSKADTLIRRLKEIYSLKNGSLKSNRKEIIHYLSKNDIIKYRIHKLNKTLQVWTTDHPTKAELYSRIELYRK